MEQVLEENARLQAALEAANQRRTPQMSLKVSPKGAVSIYGLGRFPVTLYAGQWERVIEAAPQIREFITDHNGELAHKEAA